MIHNAIFCTSDATKFKLFEGEDQDSNKEGSELYNIKYEAALQKPSWPCPDGVHATESRKGHRSNNVV